jgi:hypothetical protein
MEGDGPAMTHREQTLAANTLLVERASNVITLVVTCDTVERAKNMYDQICAEARDGCVMLDIATDPRPTINMQTLPKERPNGGAD